MQETEKYGRTYHIKFSPEIHSDDKTISAKDCEDILRDEVVITYKMDGGNCGIKTLEGVFARSHSQVTDCPTFNYIKNVHYYSKLDVLNPKYHYFGENMFAIHSIIYHKLTDYFYIFNIFDTENNEWLSWEEVKKESNRCNFKYVSVLFEGKINIKNLKSLLFKSLDNNIYGGVCEGFVIRKKNRFKNEDFSKSLMKFVRKGHVQSDSHWKINWKKQPEFLK